ncbi:MAG: hypothetical protein R6X02_17740 [Enhygromyxa sp.]
MSTVPIVCPACGAHDSSPGDQQGVHRCMYCGVQYRETRAGGQVHGAGASPAKDSRLVLILGVAVGVVGLALAVATSVLLLRGDSSDAPDNGPQVAVARTSGAGARAPTTPAKSAEPATATFEFHHNQPGYQSSYYALGYVTNTSPFAIDKPEVIAVLRDDQGQEVETHNGYAEDGVLQPGQRSPIKILVKDPKPHASADFEVVARQARYIPEQVDGLRLEAGEPKRASFGDSLEFEGKVFNEGSTPAKFVRVQIQGLDEHGKLVGVHFTFAKAELLAPGQSARWSLRSASFAERPAKFVYSVQARPAK